MLWLKHKDAVVEWLAFLHSTSAVRVQILLKCTIFIVQKCLIKNENKQKEAGNGPFNNVNCEQLMRHSWQGSRFVRGSNPSIGIFIKIWGHSRPRFSLVWSYQCRFNTVDSKLNMPITASRQWISWVGSSSLSTVSQPLPYHRHFIFTTLGK